MQVKIASGWWRTTRAASRQQPGGAGQAQAVFAARAASPRQQFADERRRGAVVLMSERMVKELNLKPLARLSASPWLVCRRGSWHRPIAAIPKALDLAG